jgi:hypothetical protein
MGSMKDANGLNQHGEEAVKKDSLHCGFVISTGLRHTQESTRSSERPLRLHQTSPSSNPGGSQRLLKNADRVTQQCNHW